MTGDNAAIATIKAALEPLLEQQRRRAEVEDPGDSYWYHRPQRDWPPKSIRDVADYDGGPLLDLAITQTDLPAAKQKALVQAWCERLPTLGAVRTLWFHSKVSQAMFDAACAMPALEGLFVKWSDIRSLEALRGHARLSHFHLGGAPSVRDLDVLATLPRLVDLEIAKVAAAGDLEFVRGLPGLRALDVAGDRNSLKRLKLGDLGPLAGLRQLERLGLSTVQLADDATLAPLAALPKLKYLGLSNAFPMAEYARLAGLRPDIACERFAPFWAIGIRCRKCKAPETLMLTGKGKPTLCATCDGDRVARHVAEFAAIRAAAAGGARQDD